MDSYTVPSINLSTFTGPLTLSDDWYTYTLRMDQNRLMICVKCSAQDKRITKAHAINISVPDGIDYAINFQRCFDGYNHITDISELSSFDSSKIICTELMFSGVWDLTDISPLSSWDMSNVHNMSGMFWECMDLEDLTPLSQWKIPDECILSGFHSNWDNSDGYINSPPLTWGDINIRQNRLLIPDWLVEKHINHQH